MNVTEYSGSEAYIFVSYCHKDESRVKPIISALASQGYRVWFDRGIDPGTDWPEVIAEHLERCSAFIACISESSLQSHNCRNELNYAILKGKPFIGVILEKVSLTPGMQMQMATYQSMYYYNFATFGEFFDRLTAAPCLAPCQGSCPEPPKPPKPAAKPIPAPEAKPAPAKAVFFSLVREKTGEVIRIDRAEFTIGRKRDMCSYAVTDNPAISRVHAVFRLKGFTLTVTDNNSLNMTSVNGRALHAGGSAALKNGDVVSVADERFVVRAELRELPQKK